MLLLPLTDGPLVLAARERGPGNENVICYARPALPDQTVVLERVEVARCRRRGASVELVLLKRRLPWR